MSVNCVIVNSAAPPTGPIVPIPKMTVTVRKGVASDLSFVDSLQRMHAHMVGWMPGKQIEGKIAAGHVLVAEDESKVQIGYCIAQDQYMGRDDVGVVFQMNVLPLKQRHLIGATLIKSCFERAAYGCKLYCCWCAQDIRANYFWESLGFIPLAFRTGSREKQRIHIFWQRRIRQGDTTTPFWFPSQTKAGAIREDRLVLPIPPGTNWRDAKPLFLPKAAPEAPTQRALPPTRPPAPAVPLAKKIAVIRSQSKHLKGLPAGKAAVITSNGFRYIDRADHVPEVVPPKPKRVVKPRAKSNPADVAAARELRDRYLEHINANAGTLMVECKYEVGREVQEVNVGRVAAVLKQLPVAA